jgi:hypothetical protein
MANNNFYSHFDKALRAGATAAGGGRLQGQAEVKLVDLNDATNQAIANASYELFGPGDVERLAAGAITRRFPAPFASNAEVTKLALVEFSAVDLPWRYTPQLAGANGLRPWLVLVVGQRSANDIVLRPDGRVTLGLVAQFNHRLGESLKWAHVHEVAGHATVARLLAPTPAGAGNYLDDTEYVACLVPAFTASGDDAWDGTRPVTCALYDWWSFRTGPAGDFRDLARKLHKAALVPKPGGKPFGIAQVSYASRAALQKTTQLQTAGALRLPRVPGDPPDPADDAPPNDVVLETAALARRIVTPDGRPVVTSPRYDAPFGDANGPDDPVDNGWIAQLRNDPRLRGAAGLGAWNAVEWQDRISAAAALKAGDLAIAAGRIRHVALGVEVSRSLWRRRLPADSPERIAVLMSSLGRLLTTAGRSALDEVAGRTPQLSRALLSSAARRALRPGPARTALSADGRAPFGAVIAAANECPDDRADPAGIHSTGRDPDAAVKQAIVEAARGDMGLADAVLQRLGSHPGPGAVAAALRALAAGPGGKPDLEAVKRFLATRTFPEPDPSVLEWDGWMNEHAAHEPCRTLDLDAFAGIVSKAIDPTVARPPAVERVLATLPGIEHIGPVEIEPELDLPLWSFVSERAPDWMLPGAGDLLDGDVVALGTNPVFVESYLVGANHQASAELRWRNVPLVTRWSPLRKFWQRKSSVLDIVPIRQWKAADPLGSAALLPPDHPGDEAVVAFRTTLFRRYPSTVVYLYQQENDWTAPAPHLALDLNKRVDPSFTGTIGRDLTFFGFPVKPQELLDYWVVLEEPPAGYRFYHAPDPLLPGSEVHSADYAHRRFAIPVRVMIGRLLHDPA